MSRLGFQFTLPIAAAVASALLSGVAAAQAPRTDTAAIYLYQGADRDQRLVEAAKKEGTLTFYTSMQTPESGPLSQAFEKKYGIKVQLWRATSDQVVQRAITEARGGRNSLDVVETNAPEVEALAREQVVAEYRTAHEADLPAWAIPPHHKWYSDRANLWIAAFNTGKVKKDEIPSSYEGFVDAKWKGRIGIEATDQDWMYGVVNFLGEQRGMDMFRKLSAMKPDMRHRSRAARRVDRSGRDPDRADRLQRQRGLDQEEGRADRLGRGRADRRAPAGACGCEKCPASERGAAVRGLHPLAGRPEAAQRSRPGALEQDAEDAARPLQVRDGRSDQMARRRTEVGEALERDVPAGALKAARDAIDKTRSDQSRARPDRSFFLRRPLYWSKRPAAWASMV